MPERVSSFFFSGSIVDFSVVLSSLTTEVCFDSFSTTLDSSFFSSACLLVSSLSDTFSSTALITSWNFAVALVNSSTCFFTSSAVAFSFFNNSLASAKTLSNSLEIPLIFSLSCTPLTNVSKLIANLFSSVLSTFAVGNAVAVSGVAGVFWGVVLFPVSTSSFLSPLVELALVSVPPWLPCDVGIFSALADIPPPKKIRDATATLAAPKWYFLIEKRVSFSPSLYLNPIIKCILSI